MARIHRPEVPEHDVAVLRLAEPVGADPPPLGYPGHVRVGDQVRTPGGGTGLIERFGTAAGARLFHVRPQVPQVPPVEVGTPVLDELGGASVLGIDALGSLLAEAGWDRSPRR